MSGDVIPPAPNSIVLGTLPDSVSLTEVTAADIESEADSSREGSEKTSPTSVNTHQHDDNSSVGNYLLTSVCNYRASFAESLHPGLTYIIWIFSTLYRS